MTSTSYYKFSKTFIVCNTGLCKCKRGRRGKPGKNGEKGQQGERGLQGKQIISPARNSLTKN